MRKEKRNHGEMSQVEICTLGAEIWAVHSDTDSTEAQGS